LNGTNDDREIEEETDDGLEIGMHISSWGGVKGGFK
jgi:hypothetical protein